MNFSDFSFDKSIEATLEKLSSQNKIPHAIIIEGNDDEKCESLAVFLTMLSVCTEENKPCGHCSQCIKAKAQAHPDIFYAYPEKKSQSYSIEQMRDIIKNASIRPNEANIKAFVFRQADTRLYPVVQNAFLKLLEEPPQNSLFLLLCKNAKGLLPTILSRCTILRTGRETTYSDEAVALAKEISRGIVSLKEWELLKTLGKISDREQACEILTVLNIIFRDCFAFHKGADSQLDQELTSELTRRINLDSALKMIDITDNAKQLLGQNININLLTTWLCGEYRRILWLR